MSDQRIMYCCTDCADNNAEACGYFDRDNLRVMPDGRWLCAGCFDETIFDRDESDREKCWSDYPQPPEYSALPPADPT
jgi:hypothetical protein